MKGLFCILLALIGFNCLGQSDGLIDTSFGFTGISLSNLSQGGYAKKIRLNSVGKIISAGTMYGANTTEYNFGATQTGADGTIDNNFGQSGFFTYDFGYDDHCTSLCIQSDDKIILGGYSTTIVSFNPFVVLTKFAVIRLNPNGTLDTTFNHTGTLEVSYPNALCAITGLAIQSDGKIIAVGTYNPTSSVQFSALRINSNGTIDSTFGSNGLVNFQFENVYKNDLASCIAIQNDGKILIGGNSNMPSVGKVIALCRLNTDGSFDNSFGTNGKVLTDIPAKINDIANAISFQNNGSIVLAGTTFNNKLVAVCKYDINGLPDATFGASGIQLFDLSNGNDVAFDVLNQVDSKLILVGYASSSAYILRLKDNGMIDSTFNNIGINLFGDASSNEGFYSVVQDVQNRLLVGGFIFDSLQKQQFSVVAFNSILFNSINSTETYISDLKIYPNPSNSYIKFLNLVPNTIVSITDLSGKMEMQTCLNSIQEIQISNLSNGIYFIQAKSSNTIQRVKFIKQ
jgi:uncharacterized delta-60 repeat protein